MARAAAHVIFYYHGPNANAEWDRSAARGGIQSVRVQRGSSYGRARYGTFGLLTSE